MDHTLRLFQKNIFFTHDKNELLSLNGCVQCESLYFIHVEIKEKPKEVQQHYK